MLKNSQDDGSDDEDEAGQGDAGQPASKKAAGGKSVSVCNSSKAKQLQLARPSNHYPPLLLAFRPPGSLCNAATTEARKESGD